MRIRVSRAYVDRCTCAHETPLRTQTYSACAVAHSFMQMQYRPLTNHSNNWFDTRCIKKFTIFV